MNILYTQYLTLQAETRQHQDLQQLQRRAAKMQAARKTAIEDLQRKREERREQAARIAQEEIVSGTGAVFLF